MVSKVELRRRLRKALEQNGSVKVTYRYDEKSFAINSEKHRVRQMSFSEVAKIVMETVKKVFGELTYAGGTFREEYYQNGKVKVHLYPTGSMGLFEIFISRIS